MPQIHYSGASYPTETGETVLDCLLRNGVAISHSCKAGACQSCLLKAPGAVPRYFLACTLRPEADIEVEQPGTEQRFPAQISSIDPLSETVLRVRLRPDTPFAYFPGQYITLFREDGLARSYSVASLPSQQEMELHVRIIRGGAMSQWLRNTAAPCETVSIQGPYGKCFYTPGNTEEPLLLAGAGTGLAPLYGIVRDALAQGHTGPIWLFHGALTSAGLYLTEELQALESRHPNFHYIPSVVQEGSQLHEAILTRFPKLTGWKAYVCGDPSLVNSLQKKLFLAGMPSKSIYADAFLPSKCS